jgi:hypothetical protein
MRLWILFGCGVLILGAAIWPFGRRTQQLAPAPVPPAVAARPTTPEPSKPELAEVIEVIDLARAYEPVREPEEPAGVVNPAAFIEVPEQPRPIPPAGELIDVMPREIIEQTYWSSRSSSWDLDGVLAGWLEVETPELTWPLQQAPIWYVPLLHAPVGFSPVSGGYKTLCPDRLIAVRSVFFTDGDEPPLEHLTQIPREMPPIQNGLLNFVPTSPTSGERPPSGPGELVFTPMCVPYTTGVTQPIPPGASIAAPAEVLSVMPREVK